MTATLAAIAAVFFALYWRERGISASLTRDIVSLRLAHPFDALPQRPETPKRDPDEVSEKQREMLEPIVAQLVAAGAKERDAWREAKRMMEDG